MMIMILGAVLDSPKLGLLNGELHHERSHISVDLLVQILEFAVLPDAFFRILDVF